MIDFEVNQGKQKIISMLADVPVRTEMELGEAVVLRLSQTLPEGCKLYFDRFFTSLSLLDALSDRNIKATGTIMKNRIPFVVGQDPNPEGPEEPWRVAVLCPS